MRLMTHPFRLAADGTVAVVVQDSDEFLDQCLQTVVGTVVGERELCLSYGIPDPVWHGVEASDIAAALLEFGPDNVTITGVTYDWVTESAARVEVSWDRVEFETEAS